MGSEHFDRNTRLYVAGLPWGMDENDIKTVFESVGEVFNIYMMRDAQGRFSGVAFITMENPLFAMKALNKSKIGDRVIFVRPAKDNRDRAPMAVSSVGGPYRNMRDEDSDESEFNSEEYNTCG